MAKPWTLNLVTAVSLTVSLSASAQVIPRPNLGVHTSVVRGICFSGPNEVVTVGLDKVAYRWNLETGMSSPIRFPIGPDAQGAAVDVIAGPNHLAIGLLSNFNSTLPTVIAVSGQESVSISVPPGVGKLAWAPGYAGLAGITFSESVVGMDLNGRVKWTYALPENSGPGRRDPRASSISYSADGKAVWVSYFQPAKSMILRLKVDSSSGKVIGTPETLNASAGGSVVDSSGNLAWVAVNGSIHWWPSGSKQATKIGPTGTFGRALALSPDGKVLAVSLDGVNDKPGRMVLLDVPSGRVRADLKSPTSVEALAFSADSTKIATVLFPSDIVVHNSATGQVLQRHARSGTLPVQLGWSNDGNALLWTSDFSFVNSLGAPIRASHSFDFTERAVSTAPNARIETKSRLTVRWDPETKRVRAKVPGAANELTAAVTLPVKDPPKLTVLSETTFAASYPAGGTDVVVFTVNPDKTTIDPIARIPVPVTLITSIALHPNRPLLAVGSIDQQVRMYLLPPPALPGSVLPSLARADLTLLTSAKGDWVVFNEDLGFYDSSAAGDQLIGFHRQENGRVNFVPVSSLASQFRKPGLIQQIFGGSRPPTSTLPTVTAASAVTKVPGLDVLEVRGTQLVRGAMSDTDVPMWRTEKSEVEILVDVPDSVRASDIQVANGTGGKSAGDGLEVEVADEGRYTVTTKLYPGTNKIRVWANTRDGKTAEDIIEVERTGGTPRNDWNVFVLAVPEFNKLPALPAVQQDGQQVADFFRAQNGKSGTVNVRQVPTAQTTTKEIIKQLDDFTASVKDGDNVLLYISSHGLPDDSGKYFIASKDIDASNASATGIDWSQVQERITKMNRSGARYVVLIVDSCFAGQAIAGRSLNPNGNEPAMSTMRALQGNTVLVTSSMPGQKSWTLTPEFLPRSMSTVKLPAQGMSLFTHALLRGLKGELGAQDNRGRIKLSTLFAYVSQEVATVVRRYQEAAESGEKPDFRQVRQDPWRSPFDDDIVIALAPAKP